MDGCKHAFPLLDYQQAVCDVEARWICVAAGPIAGARPALDVHGDPIESRCYLSAFRVPEPVL